MWNKILEEGKDDKFDNVNLIQIPSKSTINLEPKAPTGYVIKEVGPMDKKDIFESLLSTAIKAYKMTAAKGRNMSSMMTPITLVGERKESNIQLAEELNLPMSVRNEKVYIECTGACDTGADITVSDQAIRDILGRDKLPNAEGSLQGCTASTDYRRKDKLRVVTAEKKVVILESRLVNELGKGAPDSKTISKGSQTRIWYDH